MQISKVLSKIAFNGMMLFLPVSAGIVISYDLYDKGFSSPFASLLSAFVGLYLGFWVVWKLLSFADEAIVHISRTHARAAVKVRAVKRHLMDWDATEVTPA
jgi:hypothetical protein